MGAVAAPASRSHLWQVVEYQLYVGRRIWRSMFIVGVFTPLAYVLSLGIGLGTVVNNHGNSLGVPYLVYVAPAFLTAAALQIAAADAAYPIMAGFKWIRTFHGMAATPLTPAQICDGQLMWVALRIFPSSHTNPIFVEVDGKPIRASKKSAQWCLDAVDVCWKAKINNIRASERDAAAKAFDVARAAYKKILDESYDDLAK